MESERQRGRAQREEGTDRCDVVEARSMIRKPAKCNSLKRAQALNRLEKRQERFAFCFLSHRSYIYWTAEGAGCCCRPSCGFVPMLLSLTLTHAQPNRRKFNRRICSKTQATTSIITRPHHTKNRPTLQNNHPKNLTVTTGVLVQYDSNGVALVVTHTHTDASCMLPKVNLEHWNKLLLGASLCLSSSHLVTKKHRRGRQAKRRARSDCCH